jgi:hypothetical protein
MAPKTAWVFFDDLLSEFRVQEYSLEYEASDIISEISHHTR